MCKRKFLVSEIILKKLTLTQSILSYTAYTQLINFIVHHQIPHKVKHLIKKKDTTEELVKSRIYKYKNGP